MPGTEVLGDLVLPDKPRKVPPPLHWVTEERSHVRLSFLQHARARKKQFIAVARAQPRLRQDATDGSHRHDPQA
jgi:hypothetical protein